MAELSELVGKTLSKIENHDDRIDFICNDGTAYAMLHHQDCCEFVIVEDIVGDLDDLIGKPILKAEGVTTEENPADIAKDYQDSFTRTFYHIATFKGHVTIRWYGESNGYYSESVDFERIN